MLMLVLFCSGLAELQYLGSVPFTAPAYFGQRQHRRTISPTSYPPVLNAVFSLSCQLLRNYRVTQGDHSESLR